jgi:FlaA1/EpsC-like NDP-sugar epimerase
MHALIGDVTDLTRVDEVIRRHRPEIVFHAAAHKHVPLMEENPCEAIKNNVQGTRVVAQSAELHGADRFIMISTDKAVNPVSVMGASKRVAELAVQAQAVGSGTSFSIVRFGNVLASNGSVVPRFLEQIKAGGPVTVTHPDMRRFFMLIPEAVQLVLYAAAQAESGATYVLEMGEQIKVVDMARDLIRLSGLVPDEDIQISFTGLRPGEKLHEELVGATEEARPSGVDKILCVTSRVAPEPDLLERVAYLEAKACAGDEPAVVDMLLAIVADFGQPDAPAPVPAREGPERASVQQELDAADPYSQPCPKCLTGRLHRSHARSLRERFRKECTAQRLFRCDDCGWRGWALPLQYPDHRPVDWPAAPDLTSLDALVGTRPRTARPNFSPRDLR